MARPARAGARVRNESRLIRGENAVARSVETALNRLTAYSLAALEQSGLDPAVLDPDAKPWRDALGEVTAAVTTVFTTAWDAVASGSVDLDPGPYATRHIESVWNRLVGTSGEVFDGIRLELAAGRRAGESIPALTARIQTHLTDADHWTGRARTIARTETLSANNAGARGAARATAEALGVHIDDVQREWMATGDDRTRESHADADGQIIYGMDATYTVGGAELDGPGDPNGPPEEIINCRCTEVFAYPGDPDYEGTAVAASGRQERPMRRTGRRLADVLNSRPLVAAGGPDEDPVTDDEQTGVVVVALPAESDSCQSVGPEQKHATLLYFGDVAGGGNPNSLLDDTFRAALEAAVTSYAATVQPDTENVTSVDSLGDEGARVWMLGGSVLPTWRTGVIDADESIDAALGAVEQYPTFTPHVTIGYAEPDALPEAQDALGSSGQPRVGDLSGVRAGAGRQVQGGSSGAGAGVHRQRAGQGEPTRGRSSLRADAEGEGEAGGQATGEESASQGLLDDATETAAADVESIRFDRLAIWWAGEQTEYSLGEASSSETEDTMPEGDAQTAAARRFEEQVAAIAAGLGRPVAAVRQALAAALVTPVQPLHITELHYPDGTSRRYENGRLVAAAGDPAPVPADDGATEEASAGDPAPVSIEGPDADGDGMPDGWDKFWGVCVQENSQTGDGRVFAPNALYWGELPIPAGWQPQDAPGHDDAITMGRLDTLARVGDLIAYTGTYDMDGAGWEVQRLVEGGFLRGPSVDVDDCEAELLMPDGTPVDPFDMMFEGGDEDPILTVTKGRIRSMVVCRVPAMEGTQAFIANGLPVGDGTKRPSDAPAPTEDDSVAAVAAAAARVDLPPLPDPSWFANPQLTEPTPMTVTADGRIYGHIAEWGVCHIGIDGVCTEPPPSFSDYAYFAVGSVLCADGSSVHVGQITMETGHAPLTMGWRPAAAHYDNTGSAVADIAVGQDAHGIWMAGKVRDGVSPQKVAELRAVGKVSGDWREVVRGSGELELVAALAVNVPGFPIRRVGIAASGARQTALVAAGIVPTPEERALVAAGGRPMATPDLEALIAAAVSTELAARDRRGRIEAASGRIRGHRVARAVARIGRS